MVSTKKIVAVSFHTLQNEGVLKSQIIFKGTDIKCKYETKLLGFHLISNIKLDVHKQHLSCKLQRSYYVMQSLKGKTTINILRSMYFLNFHWHLRYGILFWGSFLESKKIFKVQKKVTRLISNVGRNLPAGYCL